MEIGAFNDGNSKDGGAILERKAQIKKCCLNFNSSVAKIMYKWSICEMQVINIRVYTDGCFNMKTKRLSVQRQKAFYYKMYTVIN